MSQAIDITNEQRRQVLAFLRRFLPGIAVWAYGSRVKWTASQNSDLDLIVFASSNQEERVSQLRDALAESDLPFLVDIHIWDEVPDRFHEIIRKEYVVLQQPSDFGNTPSNSPLGLAVNGWEELTLLDCTSDRQISYGIVQPGSDVPDGVPIVRVNNLTRGGIDTGAAMRVAPEIEKSYQRTRLQGGELLLSLVGTTGNVATVPAELKGWNVARAIAVIRPRADIGDDWLKLCLESASTRQYLEARANTTVQKTLNLSDVKKLPIPLPPSYWRREILSVISPLDGAITILQAETKTIAATAQAISKSWFVDFDPVRAKAEGREPEGIDAATASLFPSRLQNSEAGLIPQGWSSAQIKNLTKNIQYGYTTSAKIEPVGPKFLRITDIQGGRLDWSKVPYCVASESEIERYKLVPHDIVVARTGASTGENIYLPVVADAVFASYLVRFQFENASLARFVGAFMRTAAYSDYVGNAIGGSAQPNASAQVLAGATATIPSPPLLDRFAECVTPLDQKLWHNISQTATLGAIRDTLLPRLISGKLRVSSVEKLLEAVL